MSSAETLREARDDAHPNPAETAPDPAAGETAPRGIPDATVARLPVYLRALAQLSAGGTVTVSSGELAEAAGVGPAQLRKDLSLLGSYGTRGVGYDVAHLRFEVARALGEAEEWPVVIVGLGNLGTALANYSGFRSRGFRVVGLVDPDPALVGRRIHGLAITDLRDLEDLLARTGAVIGVVATPSEAAQDVTDRLVRRGVTSILNFAPVPLAVPDGVHVRKVDLGQELQILAYHEHRRAEDGGTRAGPAAGPGTIEPVDAGDPNPVPVPAGAPARALAHSAGHTEDED
ncbi:redox-sensing transcriptional repressor Rex [Microlunatus capsulatus]|uniref:Redox-sensing transcriptional repressor Rex n=1 Tax=Microlunatus capsulatus TaxID=99117 RepID=A0ABS4Z9R2_9ACTN|nr:redox-sensing transcriptional repressor Rex [Microlunatus capsulatus]MBP2417781.1 redox-sensing transcriptional repressor [Microlunatus capsulatus]